MTIEIKLLEKDIDITREQKIYRLWDNFLRYTGDITLATGLGLELSYFVAQTHDVRNLIALPIIIGASFYIRHLGVSSQEIENNN